MEVIGNFLFGAFGCMIFSFIGFFLFEKNETTQKFFGNKQNSIYISIVYMIYGMYLAQDDVGQKVYFVEQIGYSLGIYIVTFSGAVLATFIGMKFKFSFIDNEKFLYSLNSGIIFTSILYML